ncbi:unnamed protein product [Phytomonas sp. EM1]|nr:unnamed protein product [Phytomonas sp. EM1]|eukprot:CCW63361.1 unnamed protein product [Phytomonas sp. isolate EM1]
MSTTKKDHPHTEKEKDKAAQEPNEEESNKEKLPWIIQKWLKLVHTLSCTFLGGPRLLKTAHVVSFQKGATLLLCLGMMRLTGNYSKTATTYTALHGGYGLSWLLKEMVFPDPKWQERITIGGAINSVLLVLGPYWVIAYNAIVKKSERSNLSLCAAVVVYTIGLCLMLGSDCQKYFTLKCKKGLITDGFFSRVRHPNYLGEMMIYGSFAYVSGNVSSWLILGWVWTGLFIPFMLNKEASMSRYSEWKSYKARTGFLIPRLFSASEKKSS